MENLNIFFGGTPVVSPYLLIILTLWVMFWKGCSLWIASKNEKKVWFFILLVVNTLGILEIIYIFFIAKKNWKDIKEIFHT